ncbi:hypothetical protein OCL90_14580, partial [Enterococcus faecalis]|nr:hypothetical protein [Enterococcus faecalis]
MTRSGNILVRTPLTHDELKKAFKEDNIHASDVQLDRLVKLSEEVCSAKGNYRLFVTSMWWRAG